MRMIAVTAVLVTAAAGCRQHCDNVTNEATSVALAALDDPTPCVEDADCEVVWVSGSCFDVCSRVAHVDDVPRLEAAIEQANHEVCPRFLGCSFDRPPCIPPLQPVCNSGTCGEDVPTE